MKIRNFLLAGLLVTGSVTGAWAQQSVSPGIKADSTKEAKQIEQGSATDPAKPGATGTTVVPGSHSTVANDQKATDQRKSGGGGGGEGK